MPRRVALVCALLSACAAPSADAGDTSATETEESGDGEWVSLIDHLVWEQIVDAADDPLADHRPETINCGVGGWYLEMSTIEVATDACNYLAVTQPSLLALEEGQPMQVIFYHFDLLAPEPALGHVAILVDGQVVWEKEIEIPGDANVFVEEFASPVTAELGSPVVFHLHNHGQNTWRLQDLLAKP